MFAMYTYVFVQIVFVFDFFAANVALELRLDPAFEFNVSGQIVFETVNPAAIVASMFSG